MARKFTPEEWSKIGEIVNRTRDLQEALENKGFKVTNELTSGIYTASIFFTVKSNGVNLMTCTLYDILSDVYDIEGELFHRAEAILNTDYKALEINALRARLAELEGESNSR